MPAKKAQRKAPYKKRAVADPPKTTPYYRKKTTTSPPDNTKAVVVKSNNYPRGRYPNTTRYSNIPSVFQLSNAQLALYWDPLGKIDPPLSDRSIGNFLCVNGLDRKTFGTSTTGGNSTFVVLQYTPSAVVGGYWVENVGLITEFNISQITSSIPHSLRPLRLSLRARNTTDRTNISGSVRCLIIPQRLEWDFIGGSAKTVSAAFTNTVTVMLDSHPDSVSYSAHEFLDSKKWVLTPASDVGYHEYKTYLPAGTNAEVEAALTAGGDAEAMTTLIMEFSSTTVANNYDIGIHSQHACRYSANSFFSNIGRPQPTGATSVVSHLNRAADRLKTNQPDQPPSTIHAML